MAWSVRKLVGLAVVAGGIASAGCSAILGDFSQGGGGDASVDSQVGSSGGASSSGGSSSGGLVDGMAVKDSGIDHTVTEGGDTGTGTETGGDTGTGNETSTGDDGGMEAAAACNQGTKCAPAPCVTGITLCSEAGAQCIPFGQEYAGTQCGDGGVCNNGQCIACSVGQSCADGGSCERATIACSTGSPVCVPGGNAPNGQSCGTSLYCNTGNCAACTSGASCTPPDNPCHTGSAQCVEGGIYCQDNGGNTPAGTSCGANQVCDGNGTCSGCTSNSTCTPVNDAGTPNVCLSGTTSCSTGASVCGSATPLANGSPCGTNQVCNSGACVSCTSNAVCSPQNNSCLIGYIDCSSGTSVCTQSGVAANGTDCGSGQVCNNGTCGACTTGATCNPSGNVCQTGTTSCASGSSQCMNATNVADGTTCGNNQVCYQGTCSPCTASSQCNPGGNVCLAGKTSCATGQSVCVSSGNSGNGVTCGTNQVCNNGTCSACTAGTACQP